MLTILDNGQIMKSVQVVTSKQQAIVITPYLGGAMERKITISAPKTSISLNEPLIISFSWLRFSLGAEAYETEPVADPITYQVNDTDPDTLEPVEGVDTLNFSAAEPGTYIIRSLNPEVDNGSLEVTVSA